MLTMFRSSTAKLEQGPKKRTGMIRRYHAIKSNVAPTGPAPLPSLKPMADIQSEEFMSLRRVTASHPIEADDDECEKDTLKDVRVGCLKKLVRYAV